MGKGPSHLQSPLTGSVSALLLSGQSGPHGPPRRNPRAPSPSGSHEPGEGAPSSSPSGLPRRRLFRGRQLPSTRQRQRGPPGAARHLQERDWALGHLLFSSGSRPVFSRSGFGEGRWREVSTGKEMLGEDVTSTWSLSFLFSSNSNQRCTCQLLSPLSASPPSTHSHANPA